MRPITTALLVAVLIPACSSGPATAPEPEPATTGRLVVTGKPGEIGADGGRYLVRIEGYPVVYRGATLEPGEEGFVVLESDESPADVLAELVASGNRIVEFRQMKRTLSEVFLGLMAGGGSL